MWAETSDDIENEAFRLLIVFNRQAIRKLQSEVASYANVLEYRSLIKARFISLGDRMNESRADSGGQHFNGGYRSVELLCHASDRNQSALPPESRSDRSPDKNRS